MQIPWSRCVHAHTTPLGPLLARFWAPSRAPFGSHFELHFGTPFGPFGASKGVQKGPHPNRKRQGYPLGFVISIDSHRCSMISIRCSLFTPDVYVFCFLSKRYIKAHQNKLAQSMGVSPTFSARRALSKSVFKIDFC